MIHATATWVDILVTTIRKWDGQEESIPAIPYLVKIVLFGPENNELYSLRFKNPVHAIYMLTNIIESGEWNGTRGIYCIKYISLKSTPESVKKSYYTNDIKCIVSESFELFKGL